MYQRNPIFRYPARLDSTEQSVDVYRVSTWRGEGVGYREALPTRTYPYMVNMAVYDPI